MSDESFQTFEKFGDNEIVEHWRDRLGQFHRLDGPAIIRPNIVEKWWYHGVLHRLDGPAILQADGYEHWIKYGTTHRIDGPAMIYSNGDQHWLQNGLFHRMDGPAIIWANGHEEWLIKNNDITDSLKEACSMYEIPTNYKLWTDKDWVWFRIWVSQF